MDKGFYISRRRGRRDPKNLRMSRIEFPYPKYFVWLNRKNALWNVFYNSLSGAPDCDVCFYSFDPKTGAG
jgi:hypothetical protein